jgi:hypothetical protein
MCESIKLLFTYLYVMYDVSLNICNLSCKLVVCVVLSISLVFGFYQKTEENPKSNFSVFHFRETRSVSNV